MSQSGKQETGIISVADNGILSNNLSKEELLQVLEKKILNTSVTAKHKEFKM